MQPFVGSSVRGVLPDHLEFFSQEKSGWIDHPPFSILLCLEPAGVAEAHDLYGD
jgi:hypothetical protein